MVVWREDGPRPPWYVCLKPGIGPGRVPVWEWRCPVRTKATPRGHNPKWREDKLAARLRAGYRTV